VHIKQFTHRLRKTQILKEAALTAHAYQIDNLHHPRVGLLGAK
jgi:hypothetical protein